MFKLKINLDRLGPRPLSDIGLLPVPEFIDPRFRENKPKTLVFSHKKRAFWACFREKWVYNFGEPTCIVSRFHLPLRCETKGTYTPSPPPLRPRKKGKRSVRIRILKL